MATVSYEPFLQHIIAGIQPKEKSTASLSEAEIRAAVANAYKEAVARVADDSDGYTISQPLHVYEGIKDYPIDTPAGTTLRNVTKVLENHLNWPKAAYISDGVARLPCCAEKTVNNAYTLEMSVTLDAISDVCEFDTDFVNRYFHAILAYMRYTLSMQAARQWASLGHADRLYNMYKKEIKQRKNKESTGLIRLKTERLTDNVSRTRHSTTNSLDAHHTGTQGCNTCSSR